MAAATTYATPALRARRGDAQALAQALLESRLDTLRTFGAYEAALPGLAVPQAEEFNPPLWELGHIGWFASWWIARNPQRDRGWRADPQAPRAPAPRTDTDALYDSTRVAHATRWSLPLPDARATRADLASQLEHTLGLLASTAPATADSLYFFRLALLHEDMHHEAALYMAQALGVPIDDARWQAPSLPDPGPPLSLPAGRVALGADADDEALAFDNECGRLEAGHTAISIDRQALRWMEFLPFVEAGGYEQAQWWTAAGWQWRLAQATRAKREPAAPRYLRREAGGWQQWRHGQWQALDLRAPACHLSCHEAQAWCRWAGRRLPTETEWVAALRAAGDAFRWGDVWEWTASAFAPYPGFQPHPYREYSAPWFDGRPVLRGASFMTQARMRHSDYRNFFSAQRNDLAAGLRTCAA